MMRSVEQKQNSAVIDGEFSGKGQEFNEIVVCIPIERLAQNEGEAVCIAEIIWEKISNFHDVSWLFGSNTVLEKTDGNELNVGASRTYKVTGATETVIERDDTKRFLKWDLNTFEEYVASIEVFETYIRFKNEGRVPKKVLDTAKMLLTAKLTAVVAESQITADDILNIESIVEGLDKYTKFLLKLIPEKVLTSEKLTNDHLHPPKLKKQKESCIKILPIGEKYSLKILPKGDYHDPTDYFLNISMLDKVRIFFKTISSTWFFPILDKFLEIPEHLVEKFRAYYKFDKCFQPSNNFCLELESDDSISQLAFSGVMSMWMKDDMESGNNKAGFMCDYSTMTELKSRPGFRTLGVKAYFDCNKTLIRIHDCDKQRDYNPDPTRDYNPGWEHAKMLLKISAGQWNTASDHLLGVHMIATNSVINAAVQSLSLKHPIRRLIQPFSFRSVFVNNRSMDTLLSDGSLVIHACGYTREEFMKLLEKGFERCEMWGTPAERISNAGPNIQKLTDEGKFPYGSHSIKLYKCFEEFVGNIIGHDYDSDEKVKEDLELQEFAKYLHDQLVGTKFIPPKSYTSKSDVIKVISTFIFNATGMHEYVGTVSEYINTPKKLGFRLREGATTTDFQSWLIGMLLFTVTTVPMPKLLSDFDECYTQTHEREEWTKCVDRLKDLSAEIEKENQDVLDWKTFRSFDPKFLECSVNV